MNPPFGRSPEGTLAELPDYVAPLMAAGGVAFLAVTARDADAGFTDAGMQISPIPGGIEIDFPLITEAQIASLGRIREVGRELMLLAREAIGGDGDDFIDFDVMGAPDAVARVAGEFFSRLYGAGPETPVIFEHDGFDVP